MERTAFDYELGGTPCKVYPSVSSLKKHEPYVFKYGMSRVEIVLNRVVLKRMPEQEILRRARERDKRNKNHVKKDN